MPSIRPCGGPAPYPHAVGAYGIKMLFRPREPAKQPRSTQPIHTCLEPDYRSDQSCPGSVRGYIPRARHFLNLVAIMSWYSRGYGAGACQTA
jgi:hypothetical protein